MPFHDGFDNRQAKATAAITLTDRARRIRLEESIEDVRQMLWRDPCAFVGDRQDNEVAVPLCAERQRRT